MADQQITHPVATTILTHWPLAGRHELRTQSLVGDGSWTLGRAVGVADITFPDDFVSDPHLRLTISGRVAHILDLGSTNHTFVNNAQISHEVRIGRDQIVRIGETCFTVALPTAKRSATPELATPIRARHAHRHQEAALAVARVDYLIGGEWLPIKRSGGLDRMLGDQLGVSEERARRLVDALARSVGVDGVGARRLQNLADHLADRCRTDDG